MEIIFKLVMETRWQFYSAYQVTALKLNTLLKEKDG